MSGTGKRLFTALVGIFILAGPYAGAEENPAQPVPMPAQPAREAAKPAEPSASPSFIQPRHPLTEEQKTKLIAQLSTFPTHHMKIIISIFAHEESTDEESMVYAAVWKKVLEKSGWKEVVLEKITSQTAQAFKGFGMVVKNDEMNKPDKEAGYVFKTIKDMGITINSGISGELSDQEFELVVGSRF